MASSAVPPGAPGFGEPAPFFIAAVDGNPQYAFHVAAGRWLVLLVFASLEGEAERAAHEAVLARRDLFDDARAAFFGVSVDPADRDERGLGAEAVGLRYFWDFDQSACAALGLAGQPRPHTAVFLIDPAFRVVEAAPIDQTPRLLDRLQAELAGKPSPDEEHAPVLVLPRVFEPDLCQLLIDLFDASPSQDSGFAASVDGQTQLVVDHSLKRRRDVMVEHAELQSVIEARLVHRLMPMIKRAFNWKADYIERFLISRYDSADRGFFLAHRDDVLAGSMHRKFAVSINLNSGFVGGDVRFPEFGRRAYRAPPGGAVVFCCSLLHEVTPVTEGVRYAFLPFLYDQHGEAIRQAHLASLTG
ncbi:MAG: 2OG-Fe(II) oxygenase [Alphaproteobacteria bacterium]|nr:2OG-Fe(II) oxygenase [Alphaproteobacteria bacterium]